LNFRNFRQDQATITIFLSHWQECSIGTSYYWIIDIKRMHLMHEHETHMLVNKILDGIPLLLASRADYVEMLINSCLSSTISVDLFDFI
jgi:hypothetical protein